MRGKKKKAVRNISEYHRRNKQMNAADPVFSSLLLVTTVCHLEPHLMDRRDKAKGQVEARSSSASEMKTKERAKADKRSKADQCHAE